MQLDTTILQTRTVGALMEFINDLMIAHNEEHNTNYKIHHEVHDELCNKCNEINVKWHKAQKRRTSRYGKEKAFVDMDE